MSETKVPPFAVVARERKLGLGPCVEQEHGAPWFVLKPEIVSHGWPETPLALCNRIATALNEHAALRRQNAALLAALKQIADDGPGEDRDKRYRDWPLELIPPVGDDWSMFGGLVGNEDDCYDQGENRGRFLAGEVARAAIAKAKGEQA